QTLTSWKSSASLRRVSSVAMRRCSRAMSVNSLDVGFIGFLHWLVVKSVGFHEDHAYVVQAGDEAGSVDLFRAAGPVAKPDDVGAVLLKPGGERKALGVVHQRDVSGFAVGVIAHEDGQLAAAFEAAGAVPDELPVANQEVFERRRAR